MSAGRWNQRGQTFPDALGLWFPTGELRIMDGRLEQRFKVRIYRRSGSGWGEYFDWRAVPVVNGLIGKPPAAATPSNRSRRDVVG